MPPVETEIRDGIAIVTIDNPPMNALGQAVRQGLVDAIESNEADPTVRAMVLAGTGRVFIAGADIREFGQPPRPPFLPDVVDRIEAATKPVVAAIHGVALGGGLEIALGCHYRVAVAAARLGLPEVNLGLLPGAGGTQRTPRLTGLAAALDLILSGRQITATEAETLGLLDAVADHNDPVRAGLAFLATDRPVRRTRDLPGPRGDDAIFAPFEAKLKKTARGLVSPDKIIEALKAARDLPFDDGLAVERRLFLHCKETPQAQGLRHAFFAERAVSKVPETKSATPRPLAHVGVIGGGTMGAGIATALLNAGLRVTMVERDEPGVARGRDNLNAIYDRAVARGRLDETARATFLTTKFDATTDYRALADADLAIEAVFENQAVKTEVFANLDAVMKPGAILATNTSYLDIDALAATTGRPADVVGLHFFSPAHIMKLLEVVVVKRTAPDVTATAFALAKKLRKVAVRAGVCDGFIGNRILATCRKAADYMMEDGAAPEDIDAALRDFGFAMGPFQVSDLAGLDIGWANRKRLAPTRDARERYVAIADHICERGWFGQKTGRGYYLYDQESPRGRPDPAVKAIIESERAAKGTAPRPFSADEVQRRYLAAMINEGTKIIAEGIARRPLDVDMTLLFGYGFPRWRGGPMKYADMTGLAAVLADIRAFAGADAYFWQPAPLLVDLVNRGADFDSLNGS